MALGHQSAKPYQEQSCALLSCQPEARPSVGVESSKSQSAKKGPDAMHTDAPSRKPRLLQGILLAVALLSAVLAILMHLTTSERVEERETARALPSPKVVPQDPTAAPSSTEKIQDPPSEAPAPPIHSFNPIKAPVSIRPLPVVGSGEDRRAGLELINDSGKTISRMVVAVALFAEDGTVKRSIPHTHGIPLAGNGQKDVIELSSFWVKNDIAAVGGVVRDITWEDGTKWPIWTGIAPQQTGDSPVSMAMQGLVTGGNMSLPLIGIWNHRPKAIHSLRYRIIFLDSDGNELLNKRWGGPAVNAGQGIAVIGFERPPKDAVDLRLSLESATFEDSPGAAQYSPLTPAQVAERDEVSGGNWVVSFEDQRYLGFVVVESPDGKKQTRRFFWSPEPSNEHRFHYDHHTQGGQHQISFSPAGDDKSVVSSRFSKSSKSFSYERRMVHDHLRFTPAGPRTGRSIRGPISLFSLRSDDAPTFVLEVVFVKDKAAGEIALRARLDRIFGETP